MSPPELRKKNELKHNYSTKINNNKYNSNLLFNRKKESADEMMESLDERVVFSFTTPDNKVKIGINNTK